MQYYKKATQKFITCILQRKTFRSLMSLKTNDGKEISCLRNQGNTSNFYSSDR